MFFANVSGKRRPAKDFVSAAHRGDHIAVTLSHRITNSLGLTVRDRISVAYGKGGQIVIRRTRIGGVPLYQNGPLLAFNINVDFIPSFWPIKARALWDGIRRIEHSWCAVDAVALDFTPTAEQSHERVAELSNG